MRVIFIGVDDAAAANAALLATAAANGHPALLRNVLRCTIVEFIAVA
jgi:hypothetical protein